MSEVNEEKGKKKGHTRRDFLIIGTAATAAVVGGTYLGKNLLFPPPIITTTTTTTVTTTTTKSDFEKFIEDYPKLAKDFKLEDYYTFLEYKKDFPYIVDNEELHAFTNRHIKNWNRVLINRLNSNSTDTELQKLKKEAYGYYMKKNEETKLSIPIEESKMVLDYPNEEDREWIDGWRTCPDLLAQIDCATGNYSGSGIFRLDYLTNNIRNQQERFDKIEELYNNTDSKDSQYAWAYYNHWPVDRGANGWKNTAEMFKKYDAKMREDEKIKKAMFAYGLNFYGLSWWSNGKNPDEAYKILKTPLDWMALGYSGSFSYGTPSNKLSIDDVVFTVKKSMLDVFDANPDVYGKRVKYKGSGIGFMVEENAVRLDGVSLLEQYSPELNEIIIF